MKVCIRKELNGSLYIDKTALNRFTEEQLKQSPYNYSFAEIPDESEYEQLIIASDFNDDLTFSQEKYTDRVQKMQNEIRISMLKQKLQNTDYKAIKFAEGQLTEQEYAETKLQRQVWRNEINSLEKIK